MLRGNPKNAPEKTTNGVSQFRENPEIDDYIKANPKHWEYIQPMSPERMARTILLQDTQKHERTRTHPQRS